EVEPERRKQALSSEHPGKHLHGPRLHHRRRQRLHHGVRRAETAHQRVITAYQ
ncbi:putative gustatory receptor 59f, partial [Clarias magur]